MVNTGPQNMNLRFQSGCTTDYQKKTKKQLIQYKKNGNKKTIHKQNAMDDCRNKVK